MSISRATCDVTMLRCYIWRVENNAKSGNLKEKGDYP